MTKEISSASGFSNFQELLKDPATRQVIIYEATCGTVFDQIVSTEYIDMSRCGERVEFIKYTDIPWKPLNEANQTLEAEEPGMCRYTLGDWAYFYTMIKIDDMLRNYACGYDEAYQQFVKNVGNGFRVTAEEVAFKQMYKHATIFGNKNGGVFNMELGDVGNPYVSATFEDVARLLQSVDYLLSSSCDTSLSGKYIVLPKWVQWVLSDAALSNMIASQACQPCNEILSGKVFDNLYGLTVYYSDRLPTGSDPETGDPVWIVPFGIKGAMGFNYSMGSWETVRLQDSFGEFQRIHAAVGMGAARPDQLGYAYITPNVPVEA